MRVNFPGHVQLGGNYIGARLDQPRRLNRGVVGPDVEPTDGSGTGRVADIGDRYLDPGASSDEVGVGEVHLDGVGWRELA